MRKGEKGCGDKRTHVKTPARGRQTLQEEDTLLIHSRNGGLNHVFRPRRDVEGPHREFADLSNRNEVWTCVGANPVIGD